MSNIICFKDVIREKGRKNMLKDSLLLQIIMEIKNNRNSREKTDELISDLAKKVLELSKIESIKVPVVEIAKALGMAVVAKTLEKGLLGVMLISPDLTDKFGTDQVICVNRSSSYEHKRFAIAHELCHYLVDFDRSKQGSYSNLVYAYSEDKENPIEEHRACFFAASLLMEQSKFEQEYYKLADKIYYDKIKILKDIFEVPAKSVERRIVELGLNAQQ